MKKETIYNIMLYVGFPALLIMIEGLIIKYTNLWIVCIFNIILMFLGMYIFYIYVKQLPEEHSHKNKKAKVK